MNEDGGSGSVQDELVRESVNWTKPNEASKRAVDVEAGVAD